MKKEMINRIEKMVNRIEKELNFDVDVNKSGEDMDIVLIKKVKEFSIGIHITKFDTSRFSSPDFSTSFRYMHPQLFDRDGKFKSPYRDIICDAWECGTALYHINMYMWEYVDEGVIMGHEMLEYNPEKIDQCYEEIKGCVEEWVSNITNPF